MHHTGPITAAELAELRKAAKPKPAGSAANMPASVKNTPQNTPPKVK